MFYKGRAPHGQKSDWIMHEYRLDDSSHDTTVSHLAHVCNSDPKLFRFLVSLLLKIILNTVSEFRVPIRLEKQSLRRAGWFAVYLERRTIRKP